MNFKKNLVLFSLLLLNLFTTIRAQKLGAFVKMGNTNSWQVINEKGAPLFNKTFSMTFKDGYTANFLLRNLPIQQAIQSVIIPPSYGLFTFREGTSWGVLDIQGNILVEPQYDLIYAYSNAVALVMDHNEFFYLDIKGKPLTEKTFIEAYPFKYGYGLVKYKGKWNFMDMNGDFIHALGFRKAKNFVGKYAPVKIKSKWGVMDYKGDIVIPAIYGELKALEKDGLFAFKKNGFWGLLNLKEEILIIPKYYSMRPFHNGMAAVEINGRWGFIDSLGQQKIKCSYDKVNDFDKGLASINNGQSWGIINNNGKMVIDFGCAQIPTLEGGIIRFKKWQEKRSIALADGTIVKENLYSHLGEFNNGLAYAAIHDKFGFIDKTGTFIIEAKFDAATNFNNGIALVKKENQWNYIDKEGKYLFTTSYKAAKDFFTLE